jgi:hypothetical protein
MTADIDMLSLMLARAGKEKSRALPRRAYGNPANSVKFERERMGQKCKVEVLLDLWADWMGKPEVEGGYPAESPGMIVSWRKDDEDMAAAFECDRIARVDAAFDSLAPIYRDAINRHYGLGARVWRFDRNVDFEEAKIVMRVKLVAKGLL